MSATASCWDTSTVPAELPAPLEIGRWITPFRRSTGRWLTPADALIGERCCVVPGWWRRSHAPSARADWQRVGRRGYAVDLRAYALLLLRAMGRRAQPRAFRRRCGAPSSCCRACAARPRITARATGAVNRTGAGAAPFVAIPVVFPNTGTHFGPGYNANRTMLFLPPAAAFGRVVFFSLISGHGAFVEAQCWSGWPTFGAGSDPPPPVGLGCEYAPTSHAFSIGPVDSPARVVANSSDVAAAQYMLAGSQLGCVDKVGCRHPPPSRVPAVHTRITHHLRRALA